MKMLTKTCNSSNTYDTHLQVILSHGRTVEKCVTHVCYYVTGVKSDG